MKKGEQMSAILVLSLSVALGVSASAAVGQSLPALPSGFQADQQAAQIMAQMRKPRRPAGKPPLGPKGLEQEERPQFPPERWEDDPDRGRRPSAEQSEP